MANVLNLALKKEVFEGLQNRETNEIIIESSRWWKKRLMDIDTGRFKDFDIACVSSGSSDKIEYPIEKLELVNDNFIITLTVEKDDVEPDVDNGDSEIENNEPVQTIPDEDLLESNINPVTIETGEDGLNVPVENDTQEVIQQEESHIEDEVVTEEPEIEVDTTNVVPDKQYNDLAPVQDDKLKHAVTNLFKKFCEFNDVYVVNMPCVTIRNNGQVFGCKKRLVADRESDVKFEFMKKEFVKGKNTTNTVFIANILTYLSNLMKNSYVFVNTNLSGFRNGDNGNIIFVITAVAKKKYLFEKK